MNERQLALEDIKQFASRGLSEHQIRLGFPPEKEDRISGPLLRAIAMIYRLHGDIYIGISENQMDALEAELGRRLSATCDVLCGQYLVQVRYDGDCEETGMLLRNSRDCRIEFKKLTGIKIGLDLYTDECEQAKDIIFNALESFGLVKPDDRDYRIVNKILRELYNVDFLDAKEKSIEDTEKRNL